MPGCFVPELAVIENLSNNKSTRDVRSASSPHKYDKYTLMAIGCPNCA